MSAASSSVRHRGERMEFYYVMNNLMTLSTIREHAIPYTSKDRNSIKIKSKSNLSRKKRINPEIFQNTFVEAFRIISTSQSSDQSKQILEVLKRSIQGLKTASATLEKMNKGMSRILLGLHFNYQGMWNTLPPSLTRPGYPDQVFQGEPTLEEKIAILAERTKNPKIVLARMDMRTELAERIKNIGVVTPESIESYERELLEKKRNQRKYFNFPFLNSPLYQNLTSKISEAAMIQIVPKYVFKRSMDTTPYIIEGCNGKELARTHSAIFEKPQIPKPVELRRAASQLIDTHLLEMLKKRRGAFNP